MSFGSGLARCVLELLAALGYPYLPECLGWLHIAIDNLLFKVWPLGDLVGPRHCGR